MGWEQLTLPESLPAGYLEASNPAIVEGYVSIKEILSTPSSDFVKCWRCHEVWCEHNLNEKRADNSYKVLLKHFRAGGKINIPIVRWHNPYDGSVEQSNGHHRVIAAMDAGYTHVPYQTNRSHNTWTDDWSGTPDWPGHFE